MATKEAKTTYIGASVERKEDARLLRGETRWVDNMTLPGMLWMAVVRSPYAHAKINKVDVSKGARGRRRRGGVLGRRARGRVGGLSSVRLARDRRLPHSPAPPPDRRQGALRR